MKRRTEHEPFTGEATVVYLPTPEELTPEQENYWWEQLEIAERKVEYAKRMLGQIAVERGLGME